MTPRARELAPGSRVAIVGTGISGLVAADRLSRRHDVTIFEADDRIGGHTHTVDVELDGRQWAVDTGFIVFNDRTYPNFIRLLDRLGVASHATTMSFSVKCDATGLEYNGTSVNTMFAQRRNVVRPAFYGMIRDILRFHREAPSLLDGTDDGTTVGDYVAAQRYGDLFVTQYLLPIGAAIWSCPPGTFRSFPVRFVVEFFRNHGMLTVNDRPQWRVVTGGSREYVRRLVRPFRDRVHLRTPVVSTTRTADGVRVITDGPAGRDETPFDHVVFACHSDQALGLLADPTSAEREVLGAFPYQENEAVLHTDESILPTRRRAWAAWNYHRHRAEPDRVAVTYNMNILQGLHAPATFCVTLNDDASIAPDEILRRFTYHHPLYTVDRGRAQARHDELIGANRTSYCGAYWGYGFHEDGVNSALRVAAGLGVEEDA